MSEIIGRLIYDSRSRSFQQANVFVSLGNSDYAFKSQLIGSFFELIYGKKWRKDEKKKMKSNSPFYNQKLWDIRLIGMNEMPELANRR